MNNSVKYVMGAAVVMVVLALGMMFPKGNSVVQRVVEQVGSVVGPSRTAECESANGVVTCFSRMGMGKATTTPVAVKMPYSATTTLRTVGDGASGCKFLVSSTTASAVTFAKATSAFATTTILGTQALIAANAQAYIIASTTAAQQAAGANVFAPGTYVVVGMQGGVGTFSPTGFCTFVWDAID